jgi:hypothetical protein
MVNYRFPLKLSSASKLSTGGHQSLAVWSGTSLARCGTARFTPKSSADIERGLS